MEKELNSRMDYAIDKTVAARVWNSQNHAHSGDDDDNSRDDGLTKLILKSSWDNIMRTGLCLCNDTVVNLFICS